MTTTPTPRRLPSGRPEPSPEEWANFYAHLAAVLASAWRNMTPAERAARPRPAAAGAGR